MQCSLGPASETQDIDTTQDGRVFAKQETNAGPLDSLCFAPVARDGRKGLRFAISQSFAGGTPLPGLKNETWGTHVVGLFRTSMDGEHATK